MQTNDEITAAAMRVKTALDEFNALVLASISNGMGKSIEVSSPVDLILKAIHANSHKLNGKMSAQQVAEAIGHPLIPGGQGVFGRAVTAYGARRCKSGSIRYYIFT